MTTVLGWATWLCPNCRIGQEARRDFWAGDWGYHLAAVALPFVMVLLCTHWLARPRSSERN